LSQDGKIAVTSGYDRTVRWWDTATGHELRKLDLPGGINGLAISPDGCTVLATVNDGRLRTWDMATGRETTPVGLPGGIKFGKLTFTPTGKHMIVASGPHISVLDWPAMKPIQHSNCPSRPTNRVRPSAIR